MSHYAGTLGQGDCWVVCQCYLHGLSSPSVMTPVKWLAAVCGAHSHTDHKSRVTDMGLRSQGQVHPVLQSQFDLRELLRAKHPFFRINPIPGSAAVLEAQVLQAGQLGVGRLSWFK